MQNSVHTLSSQDPAACRSGQACARPLAGAYNRRRERGLTLIEITIALAIAAVLFAAVVSGVGALTGAQAKESAGRLAGTIRTMYDEAALSGRTCRLVFQMPAENEDAATKYWAECAEGAVASSRNRDDELRQATEEAKERARDEARGIDRRREARDYDLRDNGTLTDFYAAEQKRIRDRSMFSGYSTEEVEPRELPAAVDIAVWTKQQKDPVREGLAYLYFYPQGYTERAMIFITQGGNEWTIRVSPLTGKTEVVPEVLEIPDR